MRGTAADGLAKNLRGLIARQSFLSARHHISPHCKEQPVSPDKERKLLSALLASRNKSPTAASRWIGRAVMWVVSFVVVFYLLQNFGAPEGAQLAWTAGAFIGGVVTGALGVIDAGREQWQVIKPHVDFDAVQARIGEL
jgi:hypothetical protein